MKKIIIFKKDNRNKEIETIRYGTISYYLYLQLIKIEMKKHNINASIKNQLNMVYLYRTI